MLHYHRDQRSIKVIVLLVKENHLEEILTGSKRYKVDYKPKVIPNKFENKLPSENKLNVEKSSLSSKHRFNIAKNTE